MLLAATALAAPAPGRLRPVLDTDADRERLELQSLISELKSAIAPARKKCLQRKTKIVTPPP
jgi:hypothetical protein